MKNIKSFLFDIIFYVFISNRKKINGNVKALGAFFGLGGGVIFNVSRLFSFIFAAYCDSLNAFKAKRRKNSFEIFLSHQNKYKFMAFHMFFSFLFQV